MSAQHTKEPWMHQRGTGTIYALTNSTTNAIASVLTRGIATGSAIERPEADANAARIVACVNACAGIEDPERDVPALLAETVALREMLTEAVAVWEAGGKFDRAYTQAWRERVLAEIRKHYEDVAEARAAIARAKGEQP